MGELKSGAPEGELQNDIFKKMIELNRDQNEKFKMKHVKGPVQNERSPSAGQKTDARRTKIRFLVCTLGVISLAMSQMSRMVLNQTITMMVDEKSLTSSASTSTSDDGSCPQPVDPLSNTIVQGPTSGNATSTTAAPAPTTTITITTSPPEVATSVALGSTLSDFLPTTPSTAPQRPNLPSWPPTSPSPISMKELTTTSGLMNEWTPPVTAPSRASMTTTTTQKVAPIIPSTTKAIATTIATTTTTASMMATSTEVHYGLADLFAPEEQTEAPGKPKPASSLVDDSNSKKRHILSKRSIDQQDSERPTTVQPPGGTISSGERKKSSNGIGDEVATSASEKPTQDRFKWSMPMQQTLLGGFYSTYFIFMIIGGRIAEAYGAKYVLLLGVAGSAVINMATPWMARTSFYLLVASRALMGAIQSGVFPAMYALINEWLTMSEAAIYAPLIKMNLRLGMLIGSALPGILPGWPEVYYSTGVLSFIWSILWLVLATSNPADNTWVSKSELDHIMKKKNPKKVEEEEEAIEMTQKGEPSSPKMATVAKKTQKTPWIQILTNPSVIGLIIVKLSLNYALDFAAIVLPSYLRYVHHASRQKISTITSVMFSIQVCLIVFIGWLAKDMVKRRPFNASKTTIRKVFQGLANFGVGIALFVLTFNNCDLLFVAILLQVISFLSMFTAGGETVLPYDLSQEYPATIMAIANSIANISGVTTTALTSLILGEQGGSYERWNIVITLIAGVVTFGGFMFVVLVKAKPINFEPSKKDKPEGKPKSKLEDEVESIARIARANVNSNSTEKSVPVALNTKVELSSLGDEHIMRAGPKKD